MDLERVLYKKMTKDELIDKLIAYNLMLPWIS